MAVDYPKLHLRDLFWLVLVCALAVGWWVNRTRWQIDRKALMQAIDSEEYYLVDDSDALGRIYWLRKK
jgi:hypothetical protein